MNSGLAYKEIRLPRFVVSELSVNFVVDIDGVRYQVRDISESGFSIPQKSNGDANTKHKCKIFVDNDIAIYEGEATKVKQNSAFEAFMFSSSPLSRNLIESLEKAAFLKNSVIQDVLGNSLPDPYKTFLVDLRHFLFHVKKKCDELDDKMRVEPLEIKDSAFTALESVVYPWFYEQMISFSKRLHDFDRSFSAEQKPAAIALFRETVHEFYLTSDFVARIIAKPRGYVGDYEMMNEIYDNQAVGASSFARFMYKYGINEISSQSVRYRRGLFCDRILSYQGKDSINIASIACGPAREIADFLEQIDPSNSRLFTFYLIDQDQDALLVAKRRLVDIKLQRSLECDFHFLPMSVKDVFESSPNAKALKEITFDFIYSAGLYDYLSQSAAKLLTTILYSWLKPTGSMLVGNYNSKNSTHAISEYSAGWPLILRDEPEMIDLVPKGCKHQLLLDDNKVNIYLEINK